MRAESLLILVSLAACTRENIEAIAPTPPTPAPKTQPDTGGETQAPEITPTPIADAPATPDVDERNPPLPPGFVPLLGPEWTIVEVQQFEVLNMNKSKHNAADPDPRDYARLKNRRLCAVGSERGTCDAGGPLPDLIVNGVFYDGQGHVMGVTVRRGLSDNPVPQDTKYYGRGALAQLKNGSFAFCLANIPGPTLNEDEFDRICRNGKEPSEVSQVIQGGALLVQNGKAACSDGNTPQGCDSEIDLYRHQKFDNGGRGLKSDQMRSTQHTVFALKDDQLFVAWTEGSTAKSGRQIQSEFLTAGFDAVLKFDGGSGFFVRGEKHKTGNGSNRSGVMIKIKKNAG